MKGWRTDGAVPRVGAVGLTGRDPATIELLLDVWREMCRQIEIAASVERVATRLGELLPIDRVLVRRLDARAGHADTLGSGEVRRDPLSLAARSDYSPAELEVVRRFCSAGDVRAWDAGEEDGLRRLLLPRGLGGAALVAPLVEPAHEVEGWLVLVGRGPLGSWAEFAGALREPFTVALINDRRVHELATLREAAEAENRALLSRLGRQDIVETVVGAETGLRSVMRQVEQVAPTDAPVLILGETGSGKEVVARSIHARSARARGPFLRVNCGAIPTELVDSELFGHERGSFTGAINTRRGWFERADGGTLFLDELAELPAAAQVRLLRVLQDGTFERVGGQRTLSVDVRIVAATHRDMHEMIGDGSFRQDLWYRVSVFPIKLPPLRERQGDIGTLAAHFARKVGERLHGVPLAPTDDDVALLRAYDWPGNVRELAAVIDRAAILGDGTNLEIARALGTTGPARRHETRPQTMDRVQVDAIETALRRTRGRIEGPHGAAAILGMNPHTLRSRMRKLGIDWSRFRGA